MKIKLLGWVVVEKIKNKKTNIMASSPITSQQIEGEKVEAVADFLPLGSKIMADGDRSHEIRRHLLLGRKAMTNLDSVLKSKGLSQISSIPQLYPTLCDPMNCSMPGFPVLHYLPEFAQLMSIESVRPSNHLILCCPLLLLPSIFPSIRVFSSESALQSGGQSIAVSASASVLPMNIQD